MSLRIDVIRLTGDAGFGATLTHEHLDALTRLVDMAQAAEREACAKVCDERASSAPIGSDEQCEAEDCAAAIRARGTP